MVNRFGKLTFWPVWVGVALMGWVGAHAQGSLGTRESGASTQGFAQNRPVGPTDAGPSPRANSSAEIQPLKSSGWPIELKTATPAPAAVALQPDSTSIANGYRIAPNDLLEVDVYGVAELRRTARVTANGQIALPLIGNVRVGGLTAEAAEVLITKRYSEKHLQDPQVSVYVKEYTTEKITIEGAVARPGIYPVTGQISLLKAIALAGGGAALADLSAVTLMRPDGSGGTKKLTFDVEKIREGKIEDPALKGDDMIVVQRDSSRRILKDSLFRDILDSVNPFSVFARP